MAYKTSAALLAAIVAIAGPAFAQDSTPETAHELVTEQATDATATPAADAAEATDEATEAATEEAPAEEAATEETTEEAAEAPATDEPAAEEATASEPTDPADLQPGAYYVRSTHSDWTIRCIKADEGQPDPCELYQLLKDDQGNSVAEVTMIPLNQGEAAAGATIVAPLETDLVRGLGLKVDSAAQRGFPFNFCAPVGCVSRMGFDDSGLAGLKRGNVATVSLLPFGADPENPVELPMSLSGFTAAFDELEGIVAEALAQLDAQEATPAEGEAETEAAPAN